MNRALHVFEDLGYAVRVWSDDGLMAAFEVFEIAGLEMPESKPTFWKRGYKSDADDTEDIDAAQPCITGGVKWDGSMWWDTEDQVYGDRKSFANFGELLTRVHDLAFETMRRTS